MDRYKIVELEARQLPFWKRKYYLLFWKAKQTEREQMTSHGTSSYYVEQKTPVFS
jgi:hypothetical protein